MFLSLSGGRLHYVSLRWSEEDFLEAAPFYKHLAPNGAKSQPRDPRARQNHFFDLRGLRYAPTTDYYLAALRVALKCGKLY